MLRIASLQFKTVLKHRITQKWIERELSGASAVYDLAEAMSLVLWRAADCGVNGVSDAVYKSKLPGAKSTMRHLNAICHNMPNKVSDGFWWFLMVSDGFLWEVARRDSATVRIFQGTIWGVTAPALQVSCSMFLNTAKVQAPATSSSG